MGLHFHDLRGTTVTLLSESGSTPQQIATITGHTIGTYMKNYVREETYDRHDVRDYGEFCRLSVNGLHWFGEWKSTTPLITRRDLA